MYRKLVKEFRDRSLSPRSKLLDLPHIGPYLYERLVKTYGARGSKDLSVRQFSNAVRGMSTIELKSSLQNALKNKQANQCVGKLIEKYHVRDVNDMGFRTMVALLRVLKVNGDEHNLGRGMVSNPKSIPYPKKRTEAAKYAACKGRVACKTSGLTFESERCMYNDPSGFEGITPLPGQQIIGKYQKVMDKKEALARAINLEYVTKDASSRQRVPGKR